MRPPTSSWACATSTATHRPRRTSTSPSAPRYTWHCRAGVEHGLADTDACSSYRIREGLVLFVWREKIVPTLGLLLIDLEQLRTDGKILGQADLDLQGAVNFPVGSRFEILNVTELGPAG
nr:MoaF C-terminal domain-containing protein [Pseudoclavibacter chungangensis]